MRAPTIHLNGTHPKALLDAVMKAREAVCCAIIATADTCPNGRDYYPQGGEAMSEALSSHRKMMQSLSSVGDELLKLAMDIQDACPKTGPLALD